MRLAKQWVLLLAVISVLAGAARLYAQVAEPAAQLRINLTEPDGFAERWMTVTRVGGGPVAGLRTIESFDIGSRTFTFIDARGSEIQIPTSEIASIEFRQELAQQNPVAQEPAWNIVLDSVQRRISRSGRRTCR